MSELPQKPEKTGTLRISAQKETPPLQRMDTYRNAHIETATPERLLVMLYDSALKYLNFALQALEKKEREGIHRNLLKVQAILLELMSVLNLEVGGEMANQLYSLYDYMYRQLITANTQQEAAPIQEVITLLTPLRSAWKEAADTVAHLRAEGKFEHHHKGSRDFAG
jgi:flagellar secretion chaperone FliS